MQSVDGTMQDITITIDGTNDVPVVTGSVSASLSEDAVDIYGNLVASGQLLITDADAGESSFQAGALSGTYGSLDIDASGAWTYTVDNARADVQELGAGDALTDTIPVQSFDGTMQDVTITITIDGTNDAPVIAGVVSASLSEDVSVDAIDNLVASGQLSITDVDTGEESFQA